MYEYQMYEYQVKNQQNQQKVTKEQFLTLVPSCNTGSEVVRQLGHLGIRITRERVRQLAKKYGITKWTRESKNIDRLSHVKSCKFCGNPVESAGHKFCSRECFRSLKKQEGNVRNPLVEKVCEICGKHTFYKPYDIRKSSPRRFCSRQCEGVYIGRTFGRGIPKKVVGGIVDNGG